MIITAFSVKTVKPINFTSILFLHFEMFECFKIILILQIEYLNFKCRELCKILVSLIFGVFTADAKITKSKGAKSIGFTVMYNMSFKVKCYMLITLILYHYHQLITSLQITSTLKIIGRVKYMYSSN